MSIVSRVDALRDKDPSMTWEKMAEKLGKLNGEALRSQYRRASKSEEREGIEIDYEEEEEMIEFFFQKKKTSDWREIVGRAKTISDLDREENPLIKTAEINIKTDKPIGIAFTADWHLGDLTVDYGAWLDSINAIMDHPRMFMADLGDDRQNMRAFKVLSSVLSQAIPPKDQAKLVRGLVDELTEKEKLLCKVDGNHDVDFDERIFGEALQGYLLENMKAPRFTNKGLVFLNIGTERYTIYVFHKTRFRSIFRPSHGAYREWQFGFPADIVAGGHDHVPGFEIMNNYSLAREVGEDFGGLTFLIKVGTFQESSYGWKYFHNGGAPQVITVVLWPDSHRMQPFLSIPDAVKFLDTF